MGKCGKVESCALPFRPASGPGWLVSARRFDADRMGHEETLFTLCNGHHGVRGSLELACHLGSPGAYFAGVYDRVPVHREQLVTAPNWLDVELRMDGIRFDPTGVRFIVYDRTLDMRQGILFTRLVWQDRLGRRTRYESGRLVNAAHGGRGMIWGRVRSENWNGILTLAGGVDAAVDNPTTTPHVRVRHVRTERLAASRAGVLWAGRTERTGIPMAVATRLVCERAGEEGNESGARRCSQSASVKVRAGEETEFVKFAAFACGTDPVAAVEGDLRRMVRADVAGAIHEHVAEWAGRWEDSDVEIGGSPGDRRDLRFNIFHLMQLGHGLERLDASIGAKGLHGEGYRGHVFWDTEVFMLPFYLFTHPAAARSLLMYRVRRIAGAREHAAEYGHRGVRFPWETAVSGCDVTGSWPADLAEGKLGNWHKADQPHVTADIALAAEWYARVTGDARFRSSGGDALQVETAVFWESFVSRKGRGKRWEILGVRGPDEFHFPVDNDAYTNYVAGENLRLGALALARMREGRPAEYRRLAALHKLSARTAAKWVAIADDLQRSCAGAAGVIPQFDGYLGLKHLRLPRDANGWPVLPAKWRPRRNEIQTIKQADVLLLMRLFPGRFARRVLSENYRYYLRRDVQESSLSPGTNAIVGAWAGDADRALESFRHSARRDLTPTHESARGIHAACIGNTWQAAVCGFGGFRFDADMPIIEPRLPREWSSLRYRIRWLGRLIAVEVTRKSVNVRLLAGEPLVVRVAGREVRLA